MSSKSTELEQEALLWRKLLLSPLQKPLSAKEVARINNELDAAAAQYPSTLEELRGPVEEAANRVLKLKWSLDPIVKKVARHGLEEGYKEYAKRYKREWAGNPAHKVGLL